MGREDHRSTSGKMFRAHDGQVNLLRLISQMNRGSLQGSLQPCKRHQTGRRFRTLPGDSREDGVRNTDDTETHAFVVATKLHQTWAPLVLSPNAQELKVRIVAGLPYVLLHPDRLRTGHAVADPVPAAEALCPGTRQCSRE